MVEREMKISSFDISLKTTGRNCLGEFLFHYILCFILFSFSDGKDSTISQIKKINPTLFYVDCQHLNFIGVDERAINKKATLMVCEM